MDDYDVIISDMGRPESNQAGYDLLEQMQRTDTEIHFIIYSSEWKKSSIRRPDRGVGSVIQTIHGCF
jgi:hypothetical protein